MLRNRSLCVSGLLLAACATHAPSDQVSESWNCTPRLHLSKVWAFLSAKYDRNRDGLVTTAEYGRGETRFQNYDRNDSGTLSAEDFPEDTFFNGFTHMIVKQADSDDDDQVSRGEWRAFSESLDANRDGSMTQDEIAKVLPWASDWRLFLLSFDQNEDGVFSSPDLKLAFDDQDFDGNGVLAGKEMSGWQPTRGERGAAPSPGTAAPDFELPYAGNPSKTFHLHDAVKGQPVALIFGSYT
ncbi:MAG: hypothetical protein ACI89X_001163 [Planctomycetota bacterium]|jgi:hypothetical protein